MKVWRFYKKPEKDTSDKRYDLYALTNKKEFAKVFQEQRDMSKFIKRCSDEEISTYSELANSNRENVLDMYKLTTRTIYDNGLIGINKVKVVCTEYESQVVKEEGETASEFSLEEYWRGVVHYKAYKKKIQNALRVLQYIQFYKLFNNPITTNIDPTDDDYDVPDVEIDEVGALIKIFGDTFK